MAFAQEDPLAIPGNKRKKSAASAEDVGYDAAVGPPAFARAPQISVQPGPARVGFNPTGTQLQQAGILRPEAGPWSAANPQPMTGGDGRLLIPRPVAPAQSNALGGADRVQAAVLNQQTGNPLPPAAAIANPAAPVRTAAPGLPAQPPAIAAPNMRLNPSASDLQRDGALRPARPQNATSIDGRDLGYGQMVNGVRTFTDQDIPRIQRPQPQIGVADGGRLSIVNPYSGSVGAGLAASQNSGGRDTPELGSAPPTIQRPAPDPRAYAEASLAEAQRSARGDMAAIASMDPRSALGRAAAEARTARDFGTPDEDSRRPQNRQATYDATLGALYGGVNAGLEAAGRTAGTGLEDAGATARSNAQNAANLATNATSNATELAKANIQRPVPQTQTLADGSLATIGQDGIVRPALGPDGQPAFSQITRPAVDQGAYGRLVSDVSKSMLGDAPASPEEVYRATVAGRDTADQVFAQNNRSTNARLAASINAGAVGFLKRHPDSRDQFDLKYGKGAAARVLGDAQ